MEPNARSGPTKPLLRQQLQAVRDAISAPDRAARSARICAVLRDVVAATGRGSRTLATYSPIKSEVDVTPLRQMTLPGVQLQWAFPKIDHRDIFFHAGPPTVPGPWQLLEPPSASPRLGPDDLALVIVPGLGFDRRGHRLGYGAGYYDRALARLSPSTRFIGVCFREQLIPMIPDTDGDIPMHVIVSDDAAGEVKVHHIGALP